MGRIILTMRICRSGRRHNPLETKGLGLRPRPRRRKSFNHKHLQRLKEIEAQKHFGVPKP